MSIWGSTASFRPGSQQAPLTIALYGPTIKIVFGRSWCRYGDPQLHSVPGASKRPLQLHLALKARDISFNHHCKHVQYKDSIRTVVATYDLM